MHQKKRLAREKRGKDKTSLISIVAVMGLGINSGVYSFVGVVSLSELDWIRFSQHLNLLPGCCLVWGGFELCFHYLSHFPLAHVQNDKSSTPGLKSNTPTPRNDAPTPGTSTTPGLRPILGKPPMEALGEFTTSTRSFRKDAILI